MMRFQCLTGKACRRAFPLVAALLFLPGAIVSCTQGPTSPGDGRACTMLYAYGVSVTVSSPSGAILTNGICRLSDTVNSAWSETLMLQGDAFVGAGERPGSYRLDIANDGYRPWSTNFTLASDGCHVVGISVRATLSP